MPESSLFEYSLDREEQEEPSETDDSWALDLLETDDTKQTAPEQSEQEPEANTEEHINPFASEELTEEEEQEVLDFSDIDRDYSEEAVDENPYDDFEDDEELDDSAYHQGAFGGHQGMRYVESIEPEPVEFSWKSSNAFWHTNLFWGMLTALMVIILIAQLAIFNFDNLSRQEPYRQYYGAICRWFACELPKRVNPKAIDATNLIVRAHTTLPDVLVVDALLQNKANYSQPFPSLDLVFTDINGKAIAAKRIAAEEYLSGELTGASTMPVRQPVKISVHLRDPGAEAKGYKLEIAH